MLVGCAKKIVNYGFVIFFSNFITCALAIENLMYLGLGLHHGLFKDKNAPTLSIQQAEIVFSKYFFVNTAFETHIYGGLGNDKIYLANEEIMSNKFVDGYGLFLRNDLRLNSQSLFYTLLGYSSFTMEDIKAVERTFVANIKKISGFSYGFGVEGELPNELIMNASYIFYFREAKIGKKYKYDGINFQFGRKFY